MVLKQHIKQFLPIFLLLVGVVLLAVACREEMETPGGQVDNGMPTLRLSLTVESSLEEGDGQKYEEGIGLENVIDIPGNNYRFYFFDTDGKYIATFRPYVQSLPVREDGTPTGTYTYYFFGKLPVGVGMNFKLLVIGNWRHYPVDAVENPGTGGWELVPGETTIQELCSAGGAQYTHLSPDGAGKWLRNNESLIPFYGVREYHLADYVPANRIVDGRIKGDIIVDLQNDPVPMLRAVARVEVIVDNAYISFSDVEMNKINRIGYCGPKEALKHTDYYHNYIWEQDFIRGVHLVGNKNDENPQKLKFTKEQERSVDGSTLEKWIAYVPEYKNVGVDDYCSITLTLANPDGVSDSSDWSSPTNTLYFVKYDANGKPDNSQPFDIERNNIYRFTVTGSNANMQCHVDIQPYAECELLMDYGLMRDEAGDLMVLPEQDGSLPEYFKNYLDTYKKELPKTNGDTIAIDGDPLEVQIQIGDYYAIVLQNDGELRNAEIWLKDRDGCRVITNFGEAQEGNDIGCSTRKVISFFGSTQTIYYKDRDGEHRLQHNADHSSVILDSEGYMYYKTGMGKDAKRYSIESWDEKSGLFWIVSKDIMTGTTVYVEMNNQGQETGQKMTEEELNKR